MANPTFKQLTGFTGDTFAATFILKDNEDVPIDIENVYESVHLYLYKIGNLDSPLYDYSIGDGLTLSDTNKLTFEFTPEQIAEIAKGVYYWRFQVTYSSKKESFLTGRFIVNSERTGSGANDGTYNVTVDSSTTEITITAGESTIMAIEAASRAEGYASNLNRASIESGDAGKIERIKADESGWENVTASEAGIATETYVDDKVSLSVSKVQRNRTYLIAHRGREFAPENTIVAASQLIGKCAGVEVDAQLTSDGVPVLIHDSTVDRTTDGTGSVSSMTLSEIQALDAGSWFSDVYEGAQIPTLKEYLKFCQRAGFKMVLIHCKTTTTAAYEAYIQDILDTNTQDIAYILTTEMDEVRSLNSSVRIGSLSVNSSSKDTLIPLAVATEADILFLTPGFQDNKENIPLIKAEGILSGASVINAGDDVYEAITDYNCELIMTDNVSCFQQYVKK